MGCGVWGHVHCMADAVMHGSSAELLCAAEAVPMSTMVLPDQPQLCWG